MLSSVNFLSLCPCAWPFAVDLLQLVAVCNLCHYGNVCVVGDHTGCGEGNDYVYVGRIYVAMVARTWKINHSIIFMQYWST